MWHVKLGLSVATLPDDVEGLSEFFDQAYEQFRQLSVIDPEMFSAAGDGTATFSCYVASDDVSEAIAQASCAVRTAIHAAGGNTPRWEAPLARPSVSATPVPA